MNRLRIPFFYLTLLFWLLLWAVPSLPIAVNALAQHGHEDPVSVQVEPSPGHEHSGHANASPGWEGSKEGIAYSERNHHIAGWLVIMMGLAELSHALRLPSLTWARFLLPAAMSGTGLFLMIWSDHEAWPIGQLSLSDTFFGGNHEIIQHKTYGLLTLAVGIIETFRRLGHMGHMAWTTPLPLMAIVGGLMLFSHSHGSHPSAAKIELHHSVMGLMAITAGSSKLWSGWSTVRSKQGTSRWEFLWAGLILLIGVQLLFYSE